jgi:hypothetical protein
LVIALTFAFGYWLAHRDAEQAMAGADTLRAEVALLSADLARAREERLRMERSHQMDREAKRQAQESLGELQRERLELLKRLAYLQRLVHADEAGVVEVKELQLRRGVEPGQYRFEMILRPLVPMDERMRGRVQLSVLLSEDGQTKRRSLDRLPGSSAAEVQMDFEHCQAIEGEVRIPAGAVAEQFMVEIRPDGDANLNSSEAFLWPGVADFDCRFSPLPEVADFDDAVTVE